MAESRSDRDSCVFCKIADKKQESQLLYEDEEFICFRDKSPAAKHHYLVVPKEHLPEAKYLSNRHVSTVERMVEVGQKVISDQGGSVQDTRTGFHWPPFTTVTHLHLHCISPTSDLGFFHRNVVYKPNSFMFATSDWTLEYLKSRL